MRGSRPDVLRCSFCQKDQDQVRRLISSPSDYPRAYICNECVSVSASILDQDTQADPVPQSEDTGNVEPHPLLAHPLASKLIAVFEKWIREQSLGKDGLAEIAEMRDLAAEMVRTAH